MSNKADRHISCHKVLMIKGCSKTSLFWLSQNKVADPKIEATLKQHGVGFCVSCKQFILFLGESFYKLLSCFETSLF